MGTVPMQTEVPGIQELYTRNHGTVKVAGLSFQDGGYHIVKCPNGAYMHANGLPVSDEKELHAAIPKPFLEDALEWFKHRHESPERPIRQVIFHREGYPIFADDGSVPDFSDLYAFFSPGPILTAAIVALQGYLDAHRPEKKPQTKARKEAGTPPKKTTKPPKPKAKKLAPPAEAPAAAASA